MYLAS